MTREEAEELWKDAANWSLGEIYHCRQDPRIVVPKRRKWAGWTFNFAHSASYLWLIMIIILIGVPALCICHAAPSPTMALVGLAVLIGILVAGTLLAMRWQDRRLFDHERPGTP